MQGGPYVVFGAGWNVRCYQWHFHTFECLNCFLLECDEWCQNSNLLYLEMDTFLPEFFPTICLPCLYYLNKQCSL